MKPTKDVVACIIDTGGNYIALAVRLSNEYKTVYYCNMSWQDPYPRPNKAMIGSGIDKIEVVTSPWLVFNEIDVWIFPDVYFGDFQEWLVDQGEKVWGSRSGEELELDRELLKEHMTKLKLPVNKWEVILGLNNLRLYLEDNPNVWVKPIMWRGIGETFYSKNSILSKPTLDTMQYENGDMAEFLDFLVEQPINNALEVGYDGYSIDGVCPDAWLSGPEVKDKAYVCSWKKYSDLPKSITDFNNAMKDTMKKYGYRGFFSLENRIINGKSYMMDFTARVPDPPGPLMLIMVPNLGERIWAGANGEMVSGDPAKKFGCQLLMDSEAAEKQVQNVYYPDDIADFVMLKKCFKIDKGAYGIIPNPSYGTSDIGSIVGAGDTLEAAKDKVLSVADKIEGAGITIRKDALEDAQEAFDEYEKIK